MILLRLLFFVALAVPWPGAAQTPSEPLTSLPYSPALDLASLDRSADACTDFYRFACGGWQRNNPIPPDQASWDVYDKLQEQNLRFLWGLLLDAAVERSGRTAPEQKIGDYFSACMDEPAIDAAGATPLQPMLDRIAALSTIADMAPLLAQLHQSGTSNALFRLSAESDFADATRVIATVDAGGLGLPDRDHYLQTDAKSRQIRHAYRAHIARMFSLLGTDPASANAAAQTVMAIETGLARASLPREQRRDPHRVFHPMDTAKLIRLAPAIDWNAYLAVHAVPPGTPLNVTEPAFFRQLSAVLTRSPLADWKTYLRWHLVASQAPHLSAPFAQADFEFYRATLRGVEKRPARWKECVRWVDRDLGEALGQVFVQRAFVPATKQRALDMAHGIERAMAQRIDALEWMSAATKRAAHAKLHTLVNKVGYPDRWRDYTALPIQRVDFFGNTARSQAFEVRRQIAKIGHPVDRSEWGMTPPTVNAYYNAQLNDINFSAGILQPPLFDPRLDDAPNYGNTGSTIGHELTHAFDDEGRQFDAQGNLRDWWTPADTTQFNRRAACVVRQYSSYPIVDDIRINGRLTVGEDVADLGGATLAYIAWKTAAAAADQTLLPRDGFTPEQRFFVGMAQWACSNERPQMLRLRALTDAHSPPRYRVNGVVSNLPEFARAFACRADQAMVRAKPCRVW